MKRIHPDALQPQLRWLILTGNAIAELPETIGRCEKLQKLMLSGNKLSSLPESVENLGNLELIRLACNELKEVSNKTFIFGTMTKITQSNSRLWCVHV